VRSSQRDEEYRVMLHSSRRGSSAATRAVHVVIRIGGGDHLRRLATVGIDTTAAEQSGQFELRTTPRHIFGTAGSIRIGLLEVFEQFASGTPREDFPLSRIVCHMDWAADGRFGTSVISLSSESACE